MSNTLIHGYVIYVGGDSYTIGDGIENAFAKTLAENIEFEFISQSSLSDSYLGAKVQLEKIFLERVESLKKLIIDLSAPIILVGRSSGARIATLCAEDKKVLAMICFAYPFKRPNKPEEADRYLHLRDIAKPTLIIQGVRDEYGGLVGIQRYKFSKSVNFFYINTNHCVFH